MELKKRKLLEALMETSFVFPSDIPNIDLYMDQVTTFIESHLAKAKRYKEDKIMTKTMINNYTKNRLLPPSEKKKYSKNHLFLIIMIYYLKSILTISDIKNLLYPLNTSFFPADSASGLTIEDIFSRITSHIQRSEAATKENILKSFEASHGLFDDYKLSEDQKQDLDDTAYILQLSYEIFMRKRMIENLLDYKLDQAHPDKKEQKKEAKKATKEKSY